MFVFTLNIQWAERKCHNFGTTDWTPLLLGSCLLGLVIAIVYEFSQKLTIPIRNLVIDLVDILELPEDSHIEEVIGVGRTQVLQIQGVFHTVQIYKSNSGHFLLEGLAEGRLWLGIRFRLNEKVLYGAQGWVQKVAEYGNVGNVEYFVGASLTVHYTIDDVLDKDPKRIKIINCPDSILVFFEEGIHGEISELGEA